MLSLIGSLQSDPFLPVHVPQPAHRPASPMPAPIDDLQEAPSSEEDEPVAQPKVKRQISEAPKRKTPKKVAEEGPVKEKKRKKSEAGTTTEKTKRKKIQ